ncbi:MAG: hypothetical protein SF052_08390 [Bacteroidia bacterium]|nr:hypothetical protein [Bacteroidia bacterium]
MKRIILLTTCFLSVSFATAKGIPDVLIHILQQDTEMFIDFSYHTRKPVELIILTPGKQIAGYRLLTETSIPQILKVPLNRWKSGEYVFIFRGEGYFLSHRVQVNSGIPQ